MDATLLLTVLLHAAPVAQASASAPPAPAEAAPASAPIPAGPLLLAMPFTLDEPYESDWSADRPLISEGWLLVVEAPRAPSLPRQTAMPVLFVGDRVAERLNNGGPAAGADPVDDTAPVRLLLLVPAAAAGAGDAAPFSAAPIFFGAPGLPEAVGLEQAAAERASAISRGIAPPASAERDLARERGGQRRVFTDRAALLAHAASVLREWSPGEASRASLLEGVPLTESPANVEEPKSAPSK